jgi:putative (di)nucleoside polyphosphate hydrolase
MTTPSAYRPNATVIVTDGAGRVLLCERVQSVYDGVQTVQGGVDDGESFETAARRELAEEVGIADVATYDLLGPLSWTWKYDWPADYRDHLKAQYLELYEPKYVGQEQHYFLAALHAEVNFSLDHHSQEFSRVWWGSPQELIDGIWEPKREGMRRALQEFGLLTR